MPAADELVTGKGSPSLCFLLRSSDADDLNVVVDKGLLAHCDLVVQISNLDGFLLLPEALIAGAGTMRNNQRNRVR